MERRRYEPFIALLLSIFVPNALSPAVEDRVVSMHVITHRLR